MSHRVRSVLVACAGVVTLALAGPALGAYAPKVLVGSNTDESITIGYRQAADDDATARITFYAPLRATVDLSQAPGTRLGTATARAAIGAAGGAEANLAGPVLMGSAADPAIQGAALACTGSVSHDAVWILAVALQDQAPLNVPAFVDLTTGAEAAFSTARIVVCFRSPYVPESEGGQPLGVKPLEATMTVNNVFTFPFVGGDFVWTGLYIPYAPGTKNVNVLAAAESQGVASLPVSFDLSAKRIVKRVKVGKRRVKRKFVRLSGYLSEAGLGRSGAAVNILAGGKRVARARTNVNGFFRKTLRLKRTTRYQALATATAGDTSGTCNPLIPLSLQPLIQPTCTGLTVPAVAARSNTVRVRK
jgi:hypothetical protein